MSLPEVQCGSPSVAWTGSKSLTPCLLNPLDSANDLNISHPIYKGRVCLARPYSTEDVYNDEAPLGLLLIVGCVRENPSSSY